MMTSSNNIIKSDDEESKKIKAWQQKSIKKTELTNWELEDLSHPASDVGLFSQVEPGGEQNWKLPEFDVPNQNAGNGVMPQFDHLLGERMTPQSMLERAKSLEMEAGQVLEEALKEAERIKQQAYQEAVAKAKAETTNQLQVINKIVTEVQDWKMKVAAQGERMMLGVAIQISKNLFGNGFELDQETMREVLSQAIHKADSFGDLRIHVNPQDGEVLEYSWVEEISNMLGQNMRVIFDRSIARGGVIVKGDYGSVDATVNKKIERIENKLLEVTQDTGNK